MPAGSRLNEKRPMPVVVADRTSAVALFVILTSALGSTAPVLSVTVPCSVAVALICAMTVALRHTSARAKNTSVKLLRINPPNPFPKTKTAYDDEPCSEYYKPVDLGYS